MSAEPLLHGPTLLGCHAGRTAAEKFALKIVGMTWPQVARLAGKTLEEHKESALGWEPKQESYCIGFWNSFMDRAAEMRKAR